MSSIHFSDQSAGFSLEHTSQTIKWLTQIANNEGYSVQRLNYIFCSDEDLLSINKQYLQHDYYTDIITFDLSEIEKSIFADIYISIDRVKDNAVQYQQEFMHELLRVLSHGLLHLIGFNDKTPQQQALMTQKENECIGLFMDILA